MPQATCCPWKGALANFADARSNTQAWAPGCFETDVTPAHWHLSPLPSHTQTPTQIHCLWQHCVGLGSDKIQMTDYTDFILWPKCMPLGVEPSSASLNMTGPRPSIALLSFIELTLKKNRKSFFFNRLVRSFHGCLNRAKIRLCVCVHVGSSTV